MKYDIKIITLDLDGTLLNSEKKLSVRNRAALTAAADKGIYIVPATGRLASALTPSVRELPFLRYVISVNGALIEDVTSGEVLIRNEIPNADALRILDVLRDYPGIYDCYIDGCGYMNREMLDKASDYTIDEKHLELVRSTRKPVADLRQYVIDWARSIQKSQIMFRSRADRDRYLPEIEKRLPDFLHSCTYSSNIEINSPDAHKGAALKHLCAHLGIPLANAMSFGDGSNDISMLQSAGVGVIMSNADSELLHFGDIIAPSCDEDGVAQIIEEYVL